jgi:hypothetical protein
MIEKGGKGSNFKRHNISSKVVPDCSAAVLQKVIRGNSHMNGIESFWGYAKTRLVKFKGVDKKMFNLHLKECEFRFNHRGEDMYQILFKIFRDEPLKLP